MRTSKSSFSRLLTLKWRRMLPLVQSSSMTNHPGPSCCKAISAKPRLNFNLGFLLFCSKEFSRIIFSILYSASNHCIAGKKKTEFGFKAFISVFEFRTNPGLSWPCFEQPGPGLVFTFLTPQKQTRFLDPEVKVNTHKNTSHWKTPSYYFPFFLSIVSASFCQKRKKPPHFLSKKTGDIWWRHHWFPAKPVVSKE